MSGTQTGPSPIIRPARPEDVDALCQIARRAWAPIFAEWTAVMGEDLVRRDLGGDPLDAKAEQVRGFCARWPEWVLVTEVDGQVVGFVTFRPIAEAGIVEIGNNAVDPDHQGRGLGTAQYEHVLDWARKQGFVYAKVGTGLDDCHAPARAAYQKAGFNVAIPGVTYYRKV